LIQFLKRYSVQQTSPSWWRCTKVFQEQSIHWMYLSMLLSRLFQKVWILMAFHLLI